MNGIVADPIRGETDPSRYWTSTNLGEACPDVMTPMCWSLWRPTLELGWLYSMNALGVIPPSKVVVADNPNELGIGCFYGRQAFNVDVIKETMAALPGISPDDFERDLMGSVRPGAPSFEGGLRRLPVIMYRAPIALLRTSKRIHKLYDETYARWRATVVDGTTDVGAGDAVDNIIAAREQFERVFSVHCVWRFIFQGAQSAVAGAADKAGQPELVDQLLSGVGGLNESRMADDLWRLGQGEITESEFLADWGYHGPNEGNPYTTVWREDRRPVRTMATSMAQRTERPAERAARSQKAGEAAEEKLLNATPRLQRPMVRWLIRRMRNIIRTLHVGKSAYLITIDETRAAVRNFGQEQLDAGTVDHIDDVFFLTLEECRQLADGTLSNVRHIVATRRATRAEYKDMVLPVAFYGMPDPVRIDADTEPSTDSVVEITGAASGGGVVEGRARVIGDPGDDIDLDPGDVLVCRFTDPGWAPLMSMAEALVIDIGGSASHGAVVARELGIPYVIGTDRGTRVLQEGDRILVDGEKNVVRVLQRATPEPRSDAITA